MPVISRIGAAAARGFGLFGLTALKDAFFKYVTLLLPGNGTNGAQNNTFLDSSTNNFTITRNGNTTQGTFSPFSQTGWSNYFDGSGDYLSVASATALNLSTGDFTIECWVYPITGINDVDAIISKRSSSTFNGGEWRIAYRSASTAFGIACGSNNVDRLTPAIALNQWNHVAFVRSSGTLSCYANGVRGDNLTWTDSLDNPESLRIGLNVATYDFPGYISNVRIVKGTAVYSGATYTVPTTPLTAITNTSLLTCQANRFLDASSNNFTVTPTGDTSVQAFSPFNPTSAWSASSNGGSGYFDGSGDYLTFLNSSAFAFGTGAFTIEGWVNSSALNDKFILSGRAAIGTMHITYGGFGGSTVGCLRYVGSSTITSGTVLISNNAWNHFAVVRDGSNNITLYVNGVSVGTGTDTTNYTTTSGTWYINANDSGPAAGGAGYISNLRIVKGTQVYTTAFTPPTAPLTAITNTSLLLSATNGGITDATAKNDLETVGNAQISTTQSKFGGSSMYFDGTGDRLTIPFTNDFLELGIGGQNFTVEAWIYPTNTMASVGQILSKGGGTASWSTTNGAQYQWGVSSSALSWQFNSSGAAITVNSGTLTLNAWQHVAVSYDGITTRTFLNGVLQATSTSSYTAPTTRNVQYIGMTQSGGFTQEFYGYIDDFRITKGIARYTSNFTPPTSAFLTL